jgi:hypothetical protein
MNAFEQRLNKGQQLIDEFKKFLEDNNIDYLNTGYESLISHGDARKRIIYNKDNTSFFIRHYPDLSIVYKQKSILVKVKNSSGIEKNCYENYLKLKNNMMIDVFLFLKNKKLCDISELVFQKTNSYDKTCGFNILVLDEVWKSPRKLEDYWYQQYLKAYKKTGKNTSGCSFAFIDWEKTKFYDLDILVTARNKYNEQ